MNLVLLNIGAAAALSLPIAPPVTMPIDHNHKAAIARGDDNADGIIDEDESGWRCDSMGNGYCGHVSYKTWQHDCIEFFALSEPGHLHPTRTLICLETGEAIDHAGGFRWNSVGQSLADALAEGGTPNADTRRWERCLTNRKVVWCPNAERPWTGRILVRL